jgi:hypothetical protein
VHPLRAIERGTAADAGEHQRVDVGGRRIDRIVARIVANIRVGVPELGRDEFVLRPRASVVGIVRPVALFQHDDGETGAGEMQRRDRP